MQAFLVSTGVVALAEMGDKTQLLALVLAARFQKTWPVVLGILLATLLNHWLAAAFGAWVAAHLGPQALRWILGLSFIGMARWILLPDPPAEVTALPHSRWGIFGTTALVFFLAEMGDKTQIATVFLAAQYPNYLWVLLGTTLGMMLANAPAVWLGEHLLRRVPVVWIHRLSALIFLLLGLSTIMFA